MPRNGGSGIAVSPWHRCDRCGRDFPFTRLSRQKGMLLCDDGCIDDLTPEFREQIIQQVLMEKQDGAPAPKLRQDFDGVEETLL